MPLGRVRPAWRGKYMAFTQQGTTLHGDGIHPTCLNYLKRLGVKYVQLMPIFDFGSVDEAKPLLRQYNWGYYPTNFNVPEGSYRTDHHSGARCASGSAARRSPPSMRRWASGGDGRCITTPTLTENPWNSTVPYYFFRQDPDGSFSNGSGCGNELPASAPWRGGTSSTPSYWAKEYHIDGFRFDLDGPWYDAESINAVRAAGQPARRARYPAVRRVSRRVPASHWYEANKANLAMLNERVGISLMTLDVKTRAAASMPGCCGRAFGSFGISARSVAYGAAATVRRPTRPAAS